MAVRLEKPWRKLVQEELGSVHGQMGVFQLANADHEIIFIGFAGGRSLFGLKGELQEHLGSADSFRLEITTAYKTRHQELLMVHFADHGHYPVLNTAEETRGRGRLSP